MNHVLDKAYFSKSKVTSFLNTLASNTAKLTGTQPADFWRKANFLNIQRGGNSQRHMLMEFSSALQRHYGLTIEQCGSPDGEYFYLDDVVFSGNRVRHDLEPWIAEACPNSCKLHIICIAYHSGGQWFAGNKIADAARAAGKTVRVTWWSCVIFEDRKTYINRSDVLRPVAFPDDMLTQQYIRHLVDAGFPPIPRVITTPPYVSSFFSSEDGRQLLEREFLVSGVSIRSRCPRLPDTIKPLGYTGLKTLGIGSVIVTHINCPNTCPPALWAGNPWYPLFAGELIEKTLWI